MVTLVLCFWSFLRNRLVVKNRCNASAAASCCRAFSATSDANWLTTSIKPGSSVTGDPKEREHICNGHCCRNAGRQSHPASAHATRPHSTPARCQRTAGTRAGTYRAGTGWSCRPWGQLRSGGLPQDYAAGSSSDEPSLGSFRIRKLFASLSPVLLRWLHPEKNSTMIRPERVRISIAGLSREGIWYHSLAICKSL